MARLVDLIADTTEARRDRYVSLPNGHFGDAEDGDAMHALLLPGKLYDNQTIRGVDWRKREGRFSFSADDLIRDDWFFSEVSGYPLPGSSEYDRQQALLARLVALTSEWDLSDRSRIVSVLGCSRDYLLGMLNGDDVIDEHRESRLRKAEEALLVPTG